MKEETSRQPEKRGDKIRSQERKREREICGRNFKEKKAEKKRKRKKGQVSCNLIPVQIFLSPPVVLPSFISHFAPVR